MNKKIFLTMVSITLIGAVLVGCAKAAPPSSVPALESPHPIITTSSTTVAAPVPTQSPVESNTPETVSSTLQAIIPLKVSEPVDAATLATNAITVKGQTQPGATVSVNDQIGTADDQGNFSIPIFLDDGICAIDTVATDDNGNQGEVLLLVNVVSSTLQGNSLNSSPVVTALKVFSPQDGDYINSNTVTVTGQAEPGAFITVNDQLGTANSSGNFSIAVNLTEGPNAIDVVSIDDDGDQNEIILLVETGNRT
jgi:hypothetical protein